jgi:hypothetical protein
MERILIDMNKLINPRGEDEPIESCELLREIANATNPDEAINNASQTPLLHQMAALQGYIVMLIHICRTGQVSGHYNTLKLILFAILHTTTNHLKALFIVLLIFYHFFM